MKVVLVTGARAKTWEELDAMDALRRSCFEAFRSLPKDSILIEGEANGADQTARDVALGLGWEVERFPADWKRYSNGAGPVRNRQMLARLLQHREKGNDIEVHAFHPLGEAVALAQKSGTADMVREAQKAGLEVTFHEPKSTNLTNERQGARLFVQKSTDEKEGE